jgi:Ca-activated chloride channel family protein
MHFRATPAFYQVKTENRARLSHIQNYAQIAGGKIIRFNPMLRFHGFACGSIGSSIAESEVPLMARLESRGYGVFRLPGLLNDAPRRTAVLRLAFLPLIVLAVALSCSGQDVNVHIEPRTQPADPAKTTSPPNNAGATGTDAASPGKGTETTSEESFHKPRFVVPVDLVLVNVTVTDDYNRIVTGLAKENFTIMEGNTAQEVRHFSSEDAPVSLGVIFDMSGSMADKIEQSRRAVIEFFKTANPQDEFFMVAFSDRPRVMAEFTKSIEEIQGKLVFTVPQGRTALLDAVYLGVSKMKDARNTKKALLIISDGGDNHSRYTENEIKSVVKEADVQIYSIGIFLNPNQPEEVAGPGLLTNISEVTGGRLFTISNVNDLADVATKIGIELRNQYVLGYRPINKTKDGHWRKIKVKLIPPKGLPHLNVYSRTGYYAPSQ